MNIEFESLLRKQDFLSEEKISQCSCFLTNVNNEDIYKFVTINTFNCYDIIA